MRQSGRCRRGFVTPAKAQCMGISGQFTYHRKSPIPTEAGKTNLVANAAPRTGWAYPDFRMTRRSTGRFFGIPGTRRTRMSGEGTLAYDQNLAGT